MTNLFFYSNKKKYSNAFLTILLVYFTEELWQEIFNKWKTLIFITIIEFLSEGNVN